MSFSLFRAPPSLSLSPLKQYKSKGCMNLTISAGFRRGFRAPFRPIGLENIEEYVQYVCLKVAAHDNMNCLIKRKILYPRNRFKNYDVCMGYCEPARQDYSPPPPPANAGGASSSAANGGGYAPPPPARRPPTQGGTESDGDEFYDEGVDPEVERHEYDPEACKVCTRGCAKEGALGCAILL